MPTRALLAIVLLALALPGLSPVAEARDPRTFYVDAARGSDSASGRSPRAAWRSLERVSRHALRPGDRVLLARGRTWTGDLTVAASGTAAQPIVVGAYGRGRRPLVTGDCVDVVGSFVRVTGIAATRCDWAGFSVSGDRVVLDRVTARGNIAGVHIREEASYATVRRSRLVRNTRMSVLTHGGTDDSGAFGVVVRGDHALVTRNRISGHVAWSHDFGPDGSAVEVYGAVGTRVTYNVAVDNNDFSELGKARTRDTLLAYNRVTSRLPGSRFLVVPGPATSFGPVLGTVAEHNTVRMTGRGSEGFTCYADCGSGSLTMRANIIVAVNKVGYSEGPVAGSGNVWFGGIRQFAATGPNVVARPRFLRPRRGDLRLRPLSPAVDRVRSTRWGRDLRGVRVPLDGDRNGRPGADAGAYELAPR